MPPLTSHEAIQPTRSELKFEINESQVAPIRGFLGSRLRPDPNSKPGGYSVCSVYLDSQDKCLMRQTIQGIRNRFKLRVRFYDDAANHPAFLEIKRREGNAVKKQRCKVNREIAKAILAGEPVHAADAILNRASTHDWEAFDEFCRLRDSINAVGSTYVLYQREAYVSPHGNDWRATFDRRLIASDYDLNSDLVLPSNGLPAGLTGTVVFELKFTNRFPDWMRHLTQAFNLMAGPFPKYVTCRERIPESDARQTSSTLSFSTSTNSKR